jgi:hypothetical protein
MQSEDSAREAKAYVDRAIERERHLGYSGRVDKATYTAAVKSAESAMRGVTDPSSKAEESPEAD